MRTMILALLFLLISNQAGAVKPGVYYCVIERMVGIQAEREADKNIYDKPRYFGRITPASQEEKFIVKIRDIDLAERELLCADKGQYSNNAEALTCSGVMIEEATLPEEKIAMLDIVGGMLLLLSSDGNIFTTGGLTTFWIYPDLRYQMSQLSGVHGNYVEEGHCEIFQE